MVNTEVKERSERRHIYFSPDTNQRLRAYLLETYGTERGISQVVNRAVREFLAREAQLRGGHER